jgi:hypothetical protein
MLADELAKLEGKGRRTCDELEGLGLGLLVGHDCDCMCGGIARRGLVQWVRVSGDEVRLRWCGSIDALSATARLGVFPASTAPLK